MKRFEYKVWSVLQTSGISYDMVQATLNQFGDKGWEIIAVTFGSNGLITVVMKKEKNGD